MTDAAAPIEDTSNLDTRPVGRIALSFAAYLPIAWDAESVKVGAETFSLKDRGLIFCYPNPGNAERLVVMMAGLFWGSQLSINHKWDNVPDFILFESKIDTVDKMDPVNNAIVAGLFGSDWRLAKELTFVNRPGE